MTTKRLDVIVNQHGAAKAQKEINGLGSAVSSTLMKYASWGIAVGAVTSAINTSIENYKRQEMAEKRLQQALGYTSRGLLDFAASLQQATAYGDESIIEAQALIAAFVKEEEAIKTATKATLDLAAAKNMDLVAAADLVSKTLGSTTNALSRYGIEVTGAVGSSERLASMADNIAEKFGGQAAASMETFAGKVKLANDNVGDLSETLGLIVTKLGDGLVVASGDVAVELNSQLQLWAALHGFYNQDIELKKEMGDQDDRLLALLDEELKKREEFKTKQLETIKQREWETRLVDELNRELIAQSGLLRDTVTPEVERLAVKYESMTGKIAKMAKVQSQVGDYVSDVIDEMSDKWTWWGEQFSGVLSNAMLANQNFFSAMLQGFIQMLNRMAAEMAAKAAIFYLLDAISGGQFSAVRTASDFIFSGFRASGGPVSSNQSYIVGESGPELFTPATAGYVSPSAGNSVSVNINIGGNVISNRRWVRDVLVPEVQAAAARGLA